MAMNRVGLAGRRLFQEVNRIPGAAAHAAPAQINTEMQMRRSRDRITGIADLADNIACLNELTAFDELRIQVSVIKSHIAE